MTLQLVNIENNLIANGTPTNVAENDVARLMHYLHCVFRVLEYTDQNAQRYRDHHHWSSLNEAEQLGVLIVAMTLRFDQLDDKVFFHSEELCRSMTSKFCASNEVRIVSETSIIKPETMVQKQAFLSFCSPEKTLNIRLS